jgi:hypothetical protein
MTEIMKRLALNSLVVAFAEYERKDLRRLTREKRAKASNATWSLFKLAIDTLVGRQVDFEDPPTKLEAVDLLKQLVFEVPNNLSDADRQIATDALTIIVALLPDEQPGGFVN